MRKIILQCLLLCLPVLAGLQVSAQNNCLQGWRYSRPVSIRNFIFGLLNDWQVKVTIDTQTLIANGQMNPDGSDIRFTTNDCCTQMPYWIQGPMNSPATVIWTRVPQLMSLDTTWIQMYYGNPAATTPISDINLVHFSIGNDSMGTDTATPGLTVTTQEYTFPIASRTVRWKIYAEDTMRLKFKVANDTNMVTGTSPFFTVPDDTVGFFEFDRELVVVAGGHPGWFTSTGGKFMNSCAPVTPCPGSCGHAVYRTGDQGVFGALDDDTCGVFPSMRVWYRRSAFVDPASTSSWPEFDREQPFTLSSPSGTTICFTDTIQLYSNSLAGATYQWYHNGSLLNGATDTVLTVTLNGSYYCVADFGQACQSFSSDTITISYSSPQVDLGPDHMLCTDGTDTITAGGWFQSFLWSDGSTASSLIINTSGTYWVEATDSFGCTDTDSVTIQLQPLPSPSITLQGSNLICKGETVNLTALDTSYYAYQWLPTGSTSGNILVTDSGTFSVVVWDMYFCSDTSASITISLHPDPVLDLGADIEFCAGDSATLDVGPGWATIIWPDSTNGQTYVTSATGDYVAVVVDSNGCATTDTVNVTSNPNPTVDLGPSDTLCATATVTLDAGASMASYAWTNGATSQTVTVGAGAYSVSIIDTNGCTATSNIVYFSVYPALGIVSIGGDLTGLAATTAPNYQWYLDGSPISGAVDSVYFPTVSGTYHVGVTDPYGCADATSNSIAIVFDTINDITEDAIPQGFSPNGDGINDVWEIIDITAYPNTSVIIMNRWGSEVYQRAPYDNTFNGTGSNGKELPDGTYFYILRLGDGREYSDYLIINR
jgi:gliding motility-associated-like protein